MFRYKALTTSLLAAGDNADAAAISSGGVFEHEAARTRAAGWTDLVSLDLAR